MIILITGSNGFLGQHFVRLFLNNGFYVIGCDLSNSSSECLADMSIKLRQNFLYKPCDITNEDQVVSLFADLEELGQFPTHLINNAAINPNFTTEGLQNSSRLESFSPNQFVLEASVSLIGSILCSKYMYIHSKKQNQKCNIVNISSDLGLIAPNQTIYSQVDVLEQFQPVKPLSYSVLKHGIHGLTKYLSTYSPSTMRSNTLFPGGIFNNQPQEFLEKLTPLIPMGRMANASDLDGAILFLCSEKSCYMTGSSLVVDGGRSVW